MAHTTRRQFGLTRITGSAAAMALLLGAAFVTGAQARHAGRASAATPTYGGAYSLRLSTAPDCLDPQKTAAAASSTIDGYVFDPLLSLNNKGHYVGDLATSFKASKGGTRLVFKLRKGVVFSNGDPFTATDVKFTFDRALDPATKSPVSASQLGSVSSVKVLNKYAVELDLKTPFRPLLSNLAGSYTSILDHKSIPNQSDTCSAPIGTGPYKIQSTGPAFSDVVLVANKRHTFGPSWVRNRGVPYITKVEFKTIASDATAISEMLSGGIDIADIPGTQLSRIQGNKNFAIHKEAAQNLIFVEFNTSHPPFDNVQARKAFVEIIDRKNIVKAALNNLGQAVYGPLPPAIPFYDKNAPRFMPKFSVSAASKLVQSTHATGPYHFLTVGVAPFSTMAEIIQADAAQAGMQLQIDAKGGLSDFISAAAKGDFDVLTLNYSYNDPDVLYYLLHSSQGHGAGLNWTNATNPALDNLIVKGRTTLQTKKVAPIYNKLQEMINKQLEFVGVADQVPLLGIRATIKGYRTNSAGSISIQDLYIKTK